MMRRSRSLLMTTISAAALVSAAAVTDAGALQKSNFGLLEQQGQWKVGTVEAGEMAYCAMVGNFDKKVVFALARNPEGLGSIALNFDEALFDEGKSYEVIVKTAGSASRTLAGIATTSRSVVVQTGEGDQLFPSAAREDVLSVKLPTVDVAFSLQNFSRARKKLESCANTASAGDVTPPPAVKVPAVESSGLAPADVEAAKLSGAAGGGYAVPESDAHAFSDMEAELEREAQEHENASSSAIEWFDQKQAEISKELSEKKDEARELEQAEKSQNPLRKLIASIGGGKVGGAEKSVQEPLSTGLKAQEQDAHQAEIATEAGLRETAAIQQERNVSKELEERYAMLQREHDALRRERASLSDSTAEMKALKAEMVGLQAELASVHSERDTMGTRLAQAEAAKRQVEDRLLDAERQNKVLSAALSAKEQELAQASSTAGELDGVRSEISALEASHAETVARLEKQIAEKAEAYDRLKSEHETLKTASAESAAAYRDADTAHAEVTRLQALLDDIELQRTAETERAERLSADLAASREQIASLKASLTVASARDFATGADAKAQETEIAEDLAGKEPASGGESPDVVSGRAISKGDIVWDAVPPQVRIETPKTVQAEAREILPDFSAAPVDETPVKEVTAVRAIPPKPVAKTARAARPEGRAAAFLENVMKHHRPAGAALQDRIGDGVATASISPVKKMQAHPSPVQASAVSTAAWATPAAKRKTSDDVLWIEPAAGVADIRPAAVPKTTQPYRAVMTAAPVTLEDALKQAGLSDVYAVPVVAGAGETVRQWTVGSISGMAEKIPASGKSFDDNVQGYLERYREDCADQLSVSVGAKSDAAAGTLAVADIQCDMPGNAYATSFVFLQGGGYMTTVLHSAYPSEGSRVRDLSGDIARAIASASRLEMPVDYVAPAEYQEAPAVLIPASQTIPSEDEFETVIVQ